MTAAVAYRRGLAQFFGVASGKIVGLFSFLLTGILVARATGPEGFGFYSAGLALVLLFDALVGQPVDSSLIRFSSLHRDNAESVSRIQVLVFRAKLAAGVVTLLAAFVVERYFDVWPGGFGAPSGFLSVVAACGAALLVTRSVACAFQIRQAFGAYARLDLAQALLRVTLAGGFLVWGVRTPTAYLLIHALCGLVVCCVVQWLNPLRLLRGPWPDRADLKRMLSYLGATSAIVLLGTVSGRVDIPILVATTAAAEAGHYSAAMQIAFLGMLLASYVAVTTQPKVVELDRQGRLAQMIKFNVYGVAAAAALYAPVAFGLLPVLVPWLFGTDFSPSVPIVQILLVGILADLLTVPILMPFAHQKIARQSLIGEATILGMFVLAIVATPVLGAITMAWLVTGVRWGKLALYILIVVRYLAGKSVPRAEPTESGST